MNISFEVKKELKDMFNPIEGILLSQEIKYDQERFVRGTNLIHRYPLNPNSAIMKIVLQRMHVLGNSKKYENRHQSLRAIHIIGTPGFGKSSCFYIAKKIQDIRVSHIIKYGCPSDTIFSTNCKLFYFSSDI